MVCLKGHKEGQRHTGGMEGVVEFGSDFFAVKKLSEKQLISTLFKDF